MEGKFKYFQLITQQTHTITSVNPVCVCVSLYMCVFSVGQAEMDVGNPSSVRMLGTHTQETESINQSLGSGDGGNGKREGRRVREERR